MSGKREYGDYSFSRYKVGVSGFYKQPLFSLLYSDDGKPVMTDDTSIAFLDAKRPYTKKILERIDFEKIVACLSIDELEQTEHDLHLADYITKSMYDDFRSSLQIGQMSFVW